MLSSRSDIYWQLGIRVLGKEVGWKCSFENQEHESGYYSPEIKCALRRMKLLRFKVSESDLRRMTREGNSDICEITKAKEIAVGKINNAQFLLEVL